MNLYGFCRNNGVNRWDYLGMHEVEIEVPEAHQGTYSSTGSGTGAVNEHHVNLVKRKVTITVNSSDTAFDRLFRGESPQLDTGLINLDFGGHSLAVEIQGINQQSFNLAYDVMNYDFHQFASELRDAPNNTATSNWAQVRDQRDMLFDRANTATAELKSRGVPQGAGPLTDYSCQQVNSVLYSALGPFPEGWSVILERRATDRPFQLLDIDHWAVVAKAPAPWNAEYLFDYWGQRPVGESPEAWFRDHFPRQMPYGDAYIPFVPQTDLPIRYDQFQDMNELYPKKVP